MQLKHRPVTSGICRVLGHPQPGYASQLVCVFPGIHQTAPVGAQLSPSHVHKWQDTVSLLGAGTMLALHESPVTDFLI